MLGYAGRILKVDLSSGSIESCETPERLARAFIGGRGLGAAFLYKEMPQGVDPLSEGNVLIFMTGPATGLPIPACARWEAVTKSPLTGMYLCSSVGGFFGARLKFAGFDGIILSGKSRSPVWLDVVDGEAELHDAGEIWGLNTEETEISIQRKLKDKRVSVASIGPAGENLVKFASVQVDMRSGGRSGSLGRGGVGAVMGSKRIKAIAVRGRGKIEVADEEGLNSLARELRKELKLDEVGTPWLVDEINEAGMFPTYNFQRGTFEGSRRINAKAMRKFVKRHTACHACSISCGKTTVVVGGRYDGSIVDGPDYETIWSFGPQCGVDQFEAIVSANMWCDLYGLDTISTGNVIGFAMECYERGLLSEKDTGGLELKFGNHEVAVGLVRKIAFREGLGDLLAEGTLVAAKRIGRGAESFAIQVKGMELPAYDPRGAWGMALGYATACRGGCHLKAWTIGDEVVARRYERFSTEGKAKLVMDFQNLRAVEDSFGLCVMGRKVIGKEELARIWAITSGWNVSVSELMRIGERIYDLERLLAVRDGISREDDTLPPRILKDPLPNLDGSTIGEENFEKMLDEYYALRGWDRQGRPTREKTQELVDLLET